MHALQTAIGLILRSWNAFITPSIPSTGGAQHRKFDNILRPVVVSSSELDSIRAAAMYSWPGIFNGRPFSNHNLYYKNRTVAINQQYPDCLTIPVVSMINLIHMVFFLHPLVTVGVVTLVTIA